MKKVSKQNKKNMFKYGSFISHKEHKSIHNNQYCCVASMILAISDNKEMAMDLMSRIYDKNHKVKK